jgi:type I restriction enzyme S subunit
MTWRELTLGDCVTLQSGGTPSKANAAYWSGPVPWVSAKDMTTLRLQDTEDHVSVEAIGNGTRLVQKGTLLAVVRGMSLAKEFRIVEVQRPMAFNQDVKAIIPRDGVDSRFILYSLLARREYVLGIADEAAHGTKRLQTDRFLAVPVSLPNLPMQRRIASILSAYDDLIENNTRRIAILEEMARRIYEEWFVRFRFPGHDQVQKVASELGLIPEEWRVGSLGEAAAINARSIRPADAPLEILYIDIASVVPGAITQKQPYRFSEAPGRARRVVGHGDVIWSCVRPNRRSYALILQPEPALIASTGFAVLSAKSVPYSYLYFAVTTDDFVGFLTNHATGAAYPAVTASTFEAAPFLIPEEEVADQFHAVVAPMLDLSETLKRKNTNLRATRDLLLPKLISGELDVSTLSEPTV